MITTLLLDVDGVLVSGSGTFTETMERGYAWRHGYRTFQQALVRSPMGPAMIGAGGDLLTATEALIGAHVEGLTAADFLHRLYTEDTVVDEELVALVAGLDGVRAYLATNQDPHRGAHVAGLFAGAPWLAGTMMSCDLGVAKPNPAYFTAVLDRLGQPAGACLFVDDKPANVEAAISVGIAGVVYRDLDGFRADLARHGLLTDATRR